MYKILILGAGGFVGRHLRHHLAHHLPEDSEVLATSRAVVPEDKLLALNILDEDHLSQVIGDYKPSHIINLAGIAAPALAGQNPALAWELHAKAPEALGRIILKKSPESWLFQVGTGLVYGRTARSGLPMRETDLPAPMDTYGVTKAAGDLAVQALAERGLKTSILRPFNHIGLGQSTDFAIPAFASQIGAIVTGAREPVIKVGSLDARRDFLDVADVVRAYTSLVLVGDDLPNGEIYNIASGQARSMSDMLATLIHLSGRDIAVEVDHGRPGGLPTISGDYSKIENATGWVPQNDIRDTLRSILISYSAGVADLKW